MDEKKQLIDYLLKSNPYPCLHILEAALATRKYRASEVIPEELIRDIGKGLGEVTTEMEIENLVALGILERINTDDAGGVRLKKEAEIYAADTVSRLSCSLELSIGDQKIKAEDFLDQLIHYIVDTHVVATVKEHKAGSYLLESDDGIYRIQLGTSPFWLPLIAEKDEKEEKYLIALGPFSFQHWEEMYPYYDYEEFKSRVALYDPWSRQKASLCKGGLSVYVDWFYRDRYNGRFSIPGDFCEALHNMGMMRYNDER
ncbi:MAG: hypothetical protein ACOX4U_06650 [Anaerovoracaceae bacterium]